MSYRLIDANALATNCKQVNDMPCIYADLPNGLDNSYYNLAQSNSDKSRWHELFGTPERAARILARFSPLSCAHCALYSTCGDDQDKDCLLCDYNALLRWLEGDAGCASTATTQGSPSRQGFAAMHGSESGTRRWTGSSWTCSTRTINGDAALWCRIARCAGEKEADDGKKEADDD